ncbi:MAG: bifunctional adenosylcobinamide kinase/adenosylcobinamide-phosphate guanylyltransferase [Propionibacteriaceae bacterium]|nr:bifunctional adenosylcobinamide kinase/adenosylcobinamide-phosphate guanylyltransferase [Propionibacteriaceae bacterium]
MKTLVTGGIRSGKSRCAEELLADAARVTYVAPGPRWPDDDEWRARVASHRERRPPHWRTVENQDLAEVLTDLTGPALIDCLNTWLTGQLDDLNAWSGTGWEDTLTERIDAVVAAWATSAQRLVAVTNEVGLGLVSEHRSGRIFTDWLGILNQQIAAVSDDVILVVAGRRLHL